MKLSDVQRIDLLCPDCGVALMACMPPTIGQCPGCWTIWELSKPENAKIDGPTERRLD